MYYCYFDGFDHSREVANIANKNDFTVSQEMELTDLDGLHHWIEYVGIDALGARGVPRPVGGGPGTVHRVVFRDE